MESSKSYKARSIVKAFAGVDVLHGVDLEIKSGKVHGLLGHNGAGKSTLLKIMAGAQPQDSGSLSFDGKPLKFSSPHEALGCGIGCVYQELRLIPNLTVAENLFLGREMKRAGFRRIAEMNAYSSQLLASYGVAMDVTCPLSYLSHPEKQLVEVIANLEGKVRFLFLDEPTTALDGKQAANLLAHVRTIARARHIGIALVSHKLEEVLSICDEITVLAGGRVVYHAGGNAINRQAIIAAIVGDTHKKHNNRDKENQRTRLPVGNAFLQIKNLAGERLKSVTLEVQKGEVLGLYGLVGSGCTHFLRSVYGMEKIKAGTIEIAGKLYQPTNPQQAIENGIAFLTEERKIDGFIPLMSALQNVVLSTLTRYRHHGFVSIRKMQAAAQKTLVSIDTHGVLNAPITSLSGGNQQKVLLARIIEQNARIILLDEPTKGVDIGAKADIYAIIRRLADEGRVIIVASSEEEELIEICHRIAIFRNGYCVGSPLAVDDCSPAKLREAAWRHLVKAFHM